MLEEVIEAGTEEESSEIENKPLPLVVLAAELYEDGSTRLVLNDPQGLTKSRPVVLLGMAAMISQTISETTSPIVKSGLITLDKKVSSLTEQLEKLMSLTKSILVLKES